MNIYSFFLEPFLDYAFMRQALLAGAMLVLSAIPVGVFLFYRRMSLMGDALQHAILPGVAIAYFLFGLSLWPLTIGGLLAGFFMALLAGGIARLSRMKEDGSFAALFLIAVAVGVLLIAIRQNPIDLLNVLFGNILAITNDTLLLLAGVLWLTLFLMGVFHRGLIMEAVDSHYMTVLGMNTGFYHMLFLVLAVLNLVAGFQTMGALLALGLMIIPAATAGFWARSLTRIIIAALGAGGASLFAGLLLSYHLDWPSGPTIIVASGLFYLFSVLCGRYNSLRARYFPSPHLVA